MLSRKTQYTKRRNTVLIGVIFGEKGTGKTKRLLRHANDKAKSAKGSIVFIDDDNSYMFDLSSSIRFINAAEYELSSPERLFGFISGIAAQDFDLETVYVDGFKNYVNCELSELGDFFNSLSAFCEKHNLELVLSISGQNEELPAFIKPYVLED